MSEAYKMQMQMQMIYHLANMVTAMDYLPEMQQQQSRADTLGWVVDPTLMRNNGPAFRQDTEMTSIVAEFRGKVLAYNAKHGRKG